MLRGMLVVLMTLSAFGAERKVITPANGVPPVGPYSPGVFAGDYLYVSGQGAALPGGGFPTTTEEQTAQTLRNVKGIVEAAGLTMEHIVYAHLFLKEPGKLADADRAWRAAFPQNPPARAVIGIEKMPVDTPVEITVVAIRDLASKKQTTGGVLTHDRFYLAGAKSMDEMEQTLKAAGLDRSSLAWSLEVGGVFTGVAARDPKQRKQSGVCAWIGDTLFCPTQPAASGQLLKKHGELLKAAGLGFENVVATNVFLNDVGDFQKMNQEYATYFGKTPPTRTTLQPYAPKTEAPFARIAFIAVK
jgi:2-iminobutanoate/2-iminopropanoate deaminase